MLSVTPPPVEPTPAQVSRGQVASVLVGLEAAVLAGFALYYVWGLLRGEGSDPVVVLMSIVTLLIFVVGLGYVAVGLWRRHPRATAPALAVNFLLVPLGLALFQFAPPWLAGGVLLLALTVIVCALRMGRPV